MRLTFVSIAVALSSPLLAATSQSAPPRAPAEAPPASLFPPPDRVLFDATEGAHWALGKNYKARADATGFEFFPFPSADAESFEGVRFSVDALRTGDSTERAPVAGCSREGEALVLTRGRVVERYTCTFDAVEQTLLVDVRGMEGELWIDVNVETNLRRAKAPRLPLRYGDARAGVEVSAAFVIDRVRGRVPIDSESTADGYTLRVPAELVASAHGPLVIDPLITAGDVVDPPAPELLDVDVACLGDDAYYAAVETSLSGVESDVFVYRVDLGLSAAGALVAAVDQTTENWAEPAVAANPFRGDLAVVARRPFDVNSVDQIFARRVDPQTMTVGPPLLAGDIFESWAPDIAFESKGSAASRRYCVVFNDDFLGGLFTVASILDEDVTARLALNPLDSIEATNPPTSFPSVACVEVPVGPGTESRFQLAWLEVDDTAPFQERVVSQTLDRDGLPTTDVWWVAEVDGCTGIDIAGTNEKQLRDGKRPFPIAFDSGPSGAGELFVASCVDAETRGGITRVGLMADAAPSLEQRRPALAAANDQWVLVYEAALSFFGTRDAMVCTGGATELGFALAERPVLMRPGSLQQVGIKVATRYEGGQATALGRESLAAWIDAADGSLAEGALVSAIGSLAAGVQYCDAEPNSTGLSGWTAAYGDGGVASPHRIAASNLPPGVTCLTLTSRGPDFVPGVGGSSGNLCLGGNGFGRFNLEVGVSDLQGRFALPFSPTAIPQPNGFAAAQPGETWFFQTWFRDLVGGTATSNFTNAVAVRFDS